VRFGKLIAEEARFKHTDSKPYNNALSTEICLASADMPGPQQSGVRPRVEVAEYCNLSG
jgi:hypothetical protein